MTRHAVRYEAVSMAFRRPRDDRELRVLEDVHLDAAENEFTSIVGPSGCGKSTLLNLCAGLVSPVRGRVLVDGEQVQGCNGQLGYVTQDANLLPWLTVLDNVMLPLEIRGVNRRERRERARHELDQVGLAGFELHYPHQLSGGMQKRCAIARTLVYDPAIVLMDEPFGSLDAITRLVLQDQLLRLWEARHKTVLFITHDLTEAVSLSDRVAVLTRQPGRVKRTVSVPLARPRDTYNITHQVGFAEIHGELWDAIQPELAQIGPEAGAAS